MNLYLHMSSGSVVVMENVKHYNITTGPSEVRKIEVEHFPRRWWHWFGRRRITLVSSINQANIDAIAEEV